MNYSITKYSNNKKSLENTPNYFSVFNELFEEITMNDLNIKINSMKENDKYCVSTTYDKMSQ